MYMYIHNVYTHCMYMYIHNVYTHMYVYVHTVCTVSHVLYMYIITCTYNYCTHVLHSLLFTLKEIDQLEETPEVKAVGKIGWGDT